MILKLEDEHSEANTAMFKGDEATRAALGFGMLGDDYVAINGRGGLGDKAIAMRLYGSGGVKILSEKNAARRVRMFGDTAIVTGIWCRRSVREGKESTGVWRFTRVWVNRNGNWQVVSWQGTPIPALQKPAQSSTPVGPDDANHADDEAAIRKLIADHNAAFDRHDGSAIVYFTDDADTRNIGGAFFNGKAEIEKLGVALNKFFANAKRTETVQRIRFLTPDIALVDSAGEWTGYIITENGTKLTPPKGGMSFKVVVKKEGRWLIAAMRNAVSAGLAPPGSFPGTGTPNPQAQNAPAAKGDTNHAQDEAAIRKIAADVEDAWNRRDVKAMTASAHLSDNYDHINVGGHWTSGKVQVEKAMTGYFQTHNPPPSVHTPIERIRFITPDVAIVVVRNAYSNDKKTWEAMSTLVLHKMNEEWWNEAFQNTLVQSREEAIAQAARATGPLAQTEPEVITPANSKTDFSGDVAAIRKMVADSVDAWNRRDPKAETAHGTENHDHINVLGAWRQGKAETDKAMAAALATTRNNISRSISKIRFITPDVAIVIVRNEYTNDKETLKAISTSVFHKMNGEWWNEAFQNTYVRPSESSPLPNPQE